MTSNQKQLSISIPLMIFCFMGLYLSYPTVSIALVLFIPFLSGLSWTCAILVVIFSRSKFAQWLLRDDK